MRIHRAFKQIGYVPADAHWGVGGGGGDEAQMSEKQKEMSLRVGKSLSFLVDSTPCWKRYRPPGIT